MAVRTKQTRRRRDDGAALVEFSIIMPLAFALLLGMFSGGLAYNQRMDLTHAAREGARYGAALPTDQSGWATKVRDAVVNRSAGDLTASQVCVALVKNDNVVVSGGGPGPWVANGDPSIFTDPACYRDDNSDSGERVHVAVQRNGQLQWLVVTTNLKLKAQATAKHE